MSFKHIFFCILTFTLWGNGVAQQSLSFLPVSWIPANAAILDIKASEGDLYIATDKGLYKHSGGNTALLSPLFIDAVSVNKDKVWIASGDIIQELGTNMRLTLPRQSKINALEQVGNTLWIASENGLFRSGISSARVEELTERNSKFKRAKVNFVHRDKHNILWIGTADGEYRIDNDKWKQYHKGIEVIDFFENKEGMWFVSKDDMWLIDEYNREYPVGLDEDLIAGRLKDFCLDAKGVMYLASDKFVRYDPYKTEIIAFEDEISQWSSATNTLLSFEKSIIAGTNGKGMYTLDLEDTQGIKVNVVLESSVSCNDPKGASYTAYASGGTPPYVFRWNKGVFTDATVKELGPGEVRLYVQDATGNTTEKKIEVADVVKPEIRLDRIVPAHNGMSDGSIFLQANKGYSYSWEGGEEGPELKNKAAGNYTVTAKDANGCSAKMTYTISQLEGEVLIELEGVAVGEVVRVDNILFKADSTEVLESSIPVLEQILSFLANNPNVKIEIGGHTNTIPPHEYCDKLSEDRAKNIAMYFYGKGLPTDRLTYKGYGKRQPLTQDTSLEGRRRNQRVEIKILAK